MVTVQGLISVEDPRLTYQDGDVIFYTSSNPSGIFVVHKDILSANSQYFKAALSEEWGRYARSISGPGSPRVYEMDLEFDIETSMALPVVRHVNVDDSPDSQRQLASTTTGTSAPREKRQFLWSQPQKIPTGSPYSKVRIRAIYQRFFSVPACEDECNRPLNGMHFWRGDTHYQALSWVRLIWKCLLHLMYGHEISLPNIYYWTKQVSLVASLYAYADVLRMPEEILHRISLITFKLPDLWRKVCESPGMVFHFAYALKLPDLFMDAVKHLVSRSGIWELHQDYISDSCCNEEKYAMILASYATREQYLQTLRNKLRWWLDAFGQWDEKSGPGHLSPEAARYGPVLKQVFSRELFPALAQLDQACRLFGKDFQTGIAALRWLRGLASEPQQLSVLQGPFGLPIFTNASLYESASILGLVEKGLSVYNNLTIPLYTDDLVTEGRSSCPSRYIFSPGARYQDHRYFAYINPQDLFVDRPARPWPLNGELHEEGICETVKLEYTEARQAAYEYLESIGLGSVFAHLAKS